MKTYSIAEAVSKSGQTIERIQGKLTQIWEHKKNPKYTVQNGVLSDGKDSVKVVFWRRPDLADLKGQDLIIRCANGPKGMKGVESEENVYDNKTTIQLSVSQDAIVLPADQEESESAPASTVTKQSVVIANGVPIASSNGQDGTEFVRHRLMQMANLRKLCDNAAKFAANGNGLDAQHVKDIGTSFFIEAVREKLVDKMPNNKPLEAKKEVVSERDHVRQPLIDEENAQMHEVDQAF